MGCRRRRYHQKIDPTNHTTTNMSPIALRLRQGHVSGCTALRWSWFGPTRPKTQCCSTRHVISVRNGIELRDLPRRTFKHVRRIQGELLFTAPGRTVYSQFLKKVRSEFTAETSICRKERHILILEISMQDRETTENGSRNVPESSLTVCRETEVVLVYEAQD